MGGRILQADGQELPNGSTPVWLRVVYVYGIPGAIALFAFYLLAVSVTNAMASVQRDVTLLQREHRDQAYTQRAICLSLAKLAQTDPALCEPPK